MPWCTRNEAQVWFTSPLAFKTNAPIPTWCDAFARIVDGTSSASQLTSITYVGSAWWYMKPCCTIQAPLQSHPTSGGKSSKSVALSWGMIGLSPEQQDAQARSSEAVISATPSLSLDYCTKFTHQLLLTTSRSVYLNLKYLNNRGGISPSFRLPRFTCTEHMYQWWAFKGGHCPS